ncbi:aminotransferase class I/II-fold pyridoxal phosphate-dependent enzyme [Rubrivivax gelatinosus]|uniref:Aminotransferase n=1 Tax=Rubrivivax gelatinosus TaxID=28068 RepID=A0ABS1DW28_RUBGE|nr:aspartate aminotransferase [Rubrivivax gelatinosus]
MNTPASEFRPSARVARVRLSPNAVASARAKALREAGRDIINLTIGEPDFDTPAHVRAAAGQALARGDTRYPPTEGVAALRAAVAAKVARDTGLEVDPAQVLVGNGAKQLIANAFAATVEAGDEVVIPAPYWPSFPDAVSYAGGTPVFVPCAEARGFRLAPADLDAALGPATRWLVLNAPCNPTGADYGAEDWAALAEVLRRHPGVLVLLDEVYEQIRYGQPPPHLLRVAPDLRERVLLVSGVSKTYAMTGWRLGYATGARALIRAMTVVQSQFTAGVSTVAQAGALAALTGPQDFVVQALAAYAARREIVTQRLRAIPGLSLAAPAGAFFVFAGCAGLIGTVRPDGGQIASDGDFTEYLLEEVGVATMPGSAFGLSPFFRMSFAIDEASLAMAVERIAVAVSRLTPAAVPP